MKLEHAIVYKVQSYKYIAIISLQKDQQLQSHQTVYRYELIEARHSTLLNKWKLDEVAQLVADPISS